MKMNGARIMLECLKREGVDTVFGYPGGTVINIYDELFSFKEIRHILPRHEQAGTHAADGYARATGRVGVAIATSSPRHLQHPGWLNNLLANQQSTVIVPESPVVCAVRAFARR